MLGGWVTPAWLNPAPPCATPCYTRHAPTFALKMHFDPINQWCYIGKHKSQLHPLENSISAEVFLRQSCNRYNLIGYSQGPRRADEAGTPCWSHIGSICHVPMLCWCNKHYVWHVYWLVMAWHTRLRPGTNQHMLNLSTHCKQTWKE